MNANGNLSNLRASLGPLRQGVARHEVYRLIETTRDLRVFMEHHVFAVWDFMSLLKALQRSLTCVSVPWVPRGDRLIRRLINEIVLEEETDEGIDGGFASHFELYRAAMEQCGADISPIDSFVAGIRRGERVEVALARAAAPRAPLTPISWPTPTGRSGYRSFSADSTPRSCRRRYPDMPTRLSSGRES